MAKLENPVLPAIRGERESVPEIFRANRKAQLEGAGPSFSI
jgi:hypothetical protein